MSSDKIDATEKELDELSQWIRQKFSANELSLEDFQDAEARVADIEALIEERRASLSLAPQADEQQ